MLTNSGAGLTTKIEGTIVKTNAKVTGISVVPKKNAYDIGKGEIFSNSDLTVTAMYSNGTAAVVADFDVEFVDANAANFSLFGEKRGTVTYKQKNQLGNTIATASAEFVVYAVITEELTLEGVPEVEGEQRIQRYFEQFGVNGVGQKFYCAAGSSNNDMSLYGTNVQLDFSTGSVSYTINSHAGEAFFDVETDKNGQITVNCTSAPFLDIFGYVGYADKVPIAFGMYVDDSENIQVTLPMEGNDDITRLTGTANSRIFYIQAPLHSMNLSAGEHKVYFVSIFDDGIQELTHWTVNINREEIDLTQKTANVIVLAGQSNAYGASALTPLVKNIAANADYSKIFIHYSNINFADGLWKPLFSNADFEPYSPGVGGTLDGACFGPEVGLAYQLATTATTKDEVWYIIKYTTAGSMLDGQWLEGSYDPEGLVEDMGGYLGDLMITYINQSLTEIRQIHGDKINMHSFIWMQGESDALAPDCAGKYQANEAKLVNMIREEYTQYAKNGNGENIVFVSGAIAKYADIDITLTGEKASNGWVYSDIVNNGKKANAVVEWDPTGSLDTNTSFVLKNSAWIDTSSLSVGANAGENYDVHHYSSISMWGLGTWFGTAIEYMYSLIP